MPQTDSIKHINDSTFNVSDSIAKTDTLIHVDTILKTDTLKTEIISGFLGTPRASSPSSEDWVFGVILSLFIILTLSFIRASEWIFESVRTLFQIKERSSIFSNTTMNNLQSRISLVIFSTGVFSLYAYFLVYNPKNGFHFSTFLLFLAIIAAYISFKYLSIQLLGYIFVDKSKLKLTRESYFNILTYLGILLYPTLVLHIYFPENQKQHITTIGLIIITLASILIVIKLFQFFFNKVVASFYILLYLCTLEILPLIILFQVFRMIV